MTQERVADAMIRAPFVHPGVVSVAEIRDFFARRHVRMALLTASGAMGEELLGTLVPGDLESADEVQTALDLSRLDDRVVVHDLPAEHVRISLLDQGLRRAAVVDHHGALVGLLCLKRHGRGFCTDVGVAARRASHASTRYDDEGPRPPDLLRP